MDPQPSKKRMKEKLVFCGKDLISKVYEEQVVRREKNEFIPAWAACASQVKEETIKFVQEKREAEKRTQKNRGGRADKPIMIIPEIKNIIPMPPVKPLPTMTYWSHASLNIPTPESRYLSHVPFLGDDKEKAEKNAKFSTKLVNSYYDGNLHTDDKLAELLYNKPCSFDLLQYIDVLTEIESRYGDGIFLDTNVGNTKMTKPSSEHLEDIYACVENVDENCYKPKLPSLVVLEALCTSKEFPSVKPKELLKRYKSLVRSRGYVDVPMGARNIDDVEADGPVYSRDDQMDSYRSMFCFMCFTLTCVKHGLLTNEEIKAQQHVKHLDRRAVKKTQRVAKTNFECEFQDCWKNPSMDVPSRSLKGRKTKILSEWTSAEMTQFNCHEHLLQLGNDYCLVASLIYSKSCRQVKDYHEFCFLIYKTGNASDGTKTNDDLNTSDDLDAAASGIANISSDDIVDDGNIPWELCTFEPCFHEDGKCKATCKCRMANVFCEAGCGCAKTCKNRFEGCRCRTTCNTKNCACFADDRECDPDLCKSCCSHKIEIGQVSCKNVALQRRLGKSIKIQNSTICGLGAFTEESIKKGEFIGEYTGEIINNNEKEKRGAVYDERKHTFLHGITENLTIDGTIMGNVTRFINSSKQPNCKSVLKRVRGDLRLAIIAAKDIQAEEELFLDYDSILKFDSPKKGVKKKASSKYVSK